MRVLTITNMYPPHHYGGYELSCRDVMRRFEAAGHEVTVLTTTMRVAGVEDPPGERAAGVRRDLRFYWDDHVLVSPPVWRRALIERANQRALARALDDVRPDVVSVWSMGAMSLGLLTTVVERGIPALYAVCDDWLDYARRFDAWTRLFGNRPRARRAARAALRVPTALDPRFAHDGAFCFVSRSTSDRAAARTPFRFPTSTVVYSGIDPADFPLSDPGPRPWRWRLLFVGRIDERKGIATVVRALRRLPEEATLAVVGRGDDAYLRELHDLVRSLGVDHRVRFDVVDRAVLRHAYADADAVVFPSTWEEPFGLVPVEAMACATPVVVTGTGGTGEFCVDGDNCLRFPPDDDAALAGALCRLAADDGLRGRLARNGLATAAELTVDRLAEVLEAWHLAAARRGEGGWPPHRPPPPTRASAQ